MSFDLSAFASPEAREQLLDHGAVELAEQLAAAHAAGARSALVEALLARRQYKAAHGCCEKFGLEAAFPQARRLYCRQAITRLCSKSNWAAAAERAGADPELQRLVVALAVAAGDSEEARRLEEGFGLEVTVVRHGVTRIGFGHILPWQLCLILDLTLSTFPDWSARETLAQGRVIVVSSC